ncbi:MAG: hypothetical protein ACRDIB_17120, partial [Ardenticatenaceae bacterium]
GEPYPMLPALLSPDPLVHQWTWGLLFLPLDAGSLWLLERLYRRDGGKEEARRRAVIWAASPLPLWAWLTGPAPLATFLLLGALWMVRLSRRNWLLVALPLAFISLTEGPDILVTTVLLPFILLLSPLPAATGTSFALAALLAGPVVARLGLSGPAATAFRIGYDLALVPTLVEWLLMFVPLLAWTRWRERLTAVMIGGSAILLTLALFVLAPPELQAARLAESPLAPALEEMRSAPEGWFLTDDHDLWQEAVSFGVGALMPRVVSPRNVEALRSQMLSEQAPLWVLQSPGEEGLDSLETLLDDFFPAEEQMLSNGVRLRRFVSRTGAPLLPVDGAFTDGVTLTGARIPASAIVGTLLPIELHWEGEPGSETLFLHLIAPDGHIVAQHDAPPGAAPDRHTLLLPATLDPGTYILLAGRYDPVSSRRVPLARGGDTITLGEIVLTH